MLRKTVVLCAVFILITITSLNISPTKALVEQDLQGRVIILDPGHGRGSSPAYADYVEHVAMLKLAYKIKPLLEERGATVHMTRLTEDDVSLSVRAAMINQWALEAVLDARERNLSQILMGDDVSGDDASESDEASELINDILEIKRLLEITQSIIDDPKTNAPTYLNMPYDYTYTRKIHPDWLKVFEYQSDPVIRDNFLMISLHSNATPKPVNTSINGAIVFYISNNIKKNMTYFSNYSHVDRNLYFGNLLLNNIAPLGIRKVEAREYHYLITREHNVPGIIAENGFHTNSQDRAKLSDDAFLDKLAQAYDRAILDYFASYVEPSPKTSDTETSDIENETLEPVALYDPIATASEWARDGIREALNKGIIPAQLQDNYKNVITRYEFCLMAMKYIEYATGKSTELFMAERGIAPVANHFTDTEDPAILAAYAIGVTSGTSVNTFTPNGLLSREQAATLIMNICRTLGINIDGAPSCGFDDMGSASGWAKGGIDFCVANGIMNGIGNNKFDPKATYSREQSIVTFDNINIYA